MIRLNNMYKPLTTNTNKSINLDNKKNDAISLKDNQSSFKQEFLKVQQSFKRTEEERKKVMWDKSIELESTLVSMMLKQMRKTINKSGFIDGGQGEKMFQSMLDDQYAKNLSKNSDLGIAKMIYQQISGTAYTN